MNTEERKLVFDKCGGRCAYCGCELQKGWHVDHIESIRRKTRTIESHWRHKVTKEKIKGYELKKLLGEESRDDWEYIQSKEVPDGCMNPELDVIENMLPACASCNINKHGDTIEGFRESISGYLRSLNLRMVQYKMVKKYGLIEETNRPVVFYFEMLNKEQNAQASVATTAPQ